MTAVWCFLVGLALVVGLFFHTMGVLGILRFPDVYTRLHADTKATTFGSIFIALAAVLVAAKLAWAGEGGGAGTWVNLILHIAFAVVVLLVTNATGGHAIARAAWRAGHRPAAAVVDALAAGEAGEAAGPAPESEALAETPEAPAAEVAEAPGAPAAEEMPAAEPEAPEIAEVPQEAAPEDAGGTPAPPGEAPEEPDIPEIPEAPEAPEIPEAPEKPAEPRPEAAPAKAASAGWAAVLGITAEDSLLESEPVPGPAAEGERKEAEG